MGLIKDFFLGKLIKEEIDLKPSVAYIATKYSKYAVSREGTYIQTPIGDFYTTGEEAVKNYLTAPGRHILETDQGLLLPVALIQDIYIEVGSKIIDIEYRD